MMFKLVRIPGFGLSLVLIVILGTLLAACTEAPAASVSEKTSSSMAVSPAFSTVTPSSLNVAQAISTSGAPSAAATGVKVTVDLTAQNITFDKNLITVPARALVTVNFINQDKDTNHNFSVYTDEGTAVTIFKGDIIMGPSSIQYVFTAPIIPGTYYFRSDVHPTVMTGTFKVQ